MYKLALIGLGGLVGTLFRYWLSQAIDERSHSSLTQSSMFSLAVVNVIASNALGLAMVWIGAGVSRLLVPSSGGI
jgi:fluoride ion exporter CrcB/FEX